MVSEQEQQVRNVVKNYLRGLGYDCMFTDKTKYGFAVNVNFGARNSDDDVLALTEAVSEMEYKLVKELTGWKARVKQYTRKFEQVKLWDTANRTLSVMKVLVELK